MKGYATWVLFSIALGVLSADLTGQIAPSPTTPGVESDRPADARPPENRPGQRGWQLAATLDGGLVLRNDAHDLRFRLGGRFHLDLNFYDPDNERDSGLRLQSTVPAFSGAWGESLDFLVRPDLTGTDDGDRVLKDAWLRFSASPAFRVCGGYFKQHYGTEFDSRIDRLALPGRSFVSYLNGAWDLGARVDGSLADDVLYYAGYATAGVGYQLEGDRTSDPTVGARVLLRPLAWTDIPWLAGLTAGASASYSRDHDGRIHIASPLETSVIYTREFRADHVIRRNFEIGYRLGRLRARWELASADFRDISWAGQSHDLDQNAAWEGEVALALTGEDYEYAGGRERGLPGVEEATFRNGHFGALEIAARYSNAEIDREFFDIGITGYDPSTQEVRTFTGGLNWYYRRNIRLMAAWVHIIADHELSTLGGTKRDRSVVIRLQVDF